MLIPENLTELMVNGAEEGEEGEEGDEEKVFLTSGLMLEDQMDVSILIPSQDEFC